MPNDKCVVHDQDIHEIKQTISRWSKVFDGNGRPELTVRLDRLERLATAVQWLIGAVVVETLVLGANIVLYLLPRLLGH